MELKEFFLQFFCENHRNRSLEEVSLIKEFEKFWDQFLSKIKNAYPMIKENQSLISNFGIDYTNNQIFEDLMVFFEMFLINDNRKTIIQRV